MMIRVFIFLLLITISAHVRSHSEATYLGNAGVMAEVGDVKVLFDPIFHYSFSIYQLVPKDVYTAMMEGNPPFNDIDAIVISHAHGDHFDKADVRRFMLKHSQTLLFAPKQAVDEMRKVGDVDFNDRIHAFELPFGSESQTIKVNDIEVSGVRIPHAGWPSRKNIENIVFRVTIADKYTFMHMGDADADDQHYLPYKDHWQAQKTSINFPPYWFFMSAEGRDILYEIVNADEHIGVHVPVEVPKYLKNSGFKYFSIPKEKYSLN